LSFYSASISYKIFKQGLLGGTHVELMNSVIADYFSGPTELAYVLFEVVRIYSGE